MSAKPCSRCGAERDRRKPDGTTYPYCRACHNAVKRARDARLRAAMAICKRAGLTVTVATEGGHAAPIVPTRREE